MRHVSKRRQRSSLVVERLEDRLQPGTILTIDIGFDESLNPTTLDLPSDTTSQSASMRRLRQPGDTEMGTPLSENGIELDEDVGCYVVHLGSEGCGRRTDQQ